MKTAFFVKNQLIVTKAKFDGDTQKLRRELIIDLVFLKEYTSRRSNVKRLKNENRMKWMQVTAYIARTISYITKDFDNIQIKEKLDKLRKLVDSEFHEESN